MSAGSGEFEAAGRSKTTMLETHPDGAMVNVFVTDVSSAIYVDYCKYFKILLLIVKNESSIYCKVFVVL